MGVVDAGVTDIFSNHANADMVAHAMTALDSFDGMCMCVCVMTVLDSWDNM